MPRIISWEDLNTLYIKDREFECFFYQKMDAGLYNLAERFQFRLNVFMSVAVDWNKYINVK